MFTLLFELEDTKQPGEIGIQKIIDLGRVYKFYKSHRMVLARKTKER